MVIPVIKDDERLENAELALRIALTEVFRVRTRLSEEGRYSLTLSRVSEHSMEALTALRRGVGKDDLDERRAILGEA